MAKFSKLITAVVSSLALAVSGCMPVMVSPQASVVAAQLTDQVFITSDGLALKLSTWPAAQPKAVIIALHGFNDYRQFFKQAGNYLAQQGITCYAYDQRGFGESPARGLWAGQDAYAADLRQMTALVKARHPHLPVYLLGESMGGAVVIAAMSRPDKPDAAGVILSAPAVWGRQTMPWYQTSLLWALSHTLPWLTLTGSGLKIMASDNIDMLRELGRDPLVIKATRVDAMYGLTNLMDTALNAAPSLSSQTLLLYGKKDQVIPAEPTALFVQGLLAQQPQQKTVTYYENGYHMLLRDLQAPMVWHDVAGWIQQNSQQLFTAESAKEQPDTVNQ